MTQRHQQTEQANGRVLTTDEAVEYLLAHVAELEQRLGGEGSDEAHQLREELLLRKAVREHSRQTVEASL